MYQLLCEFIRTLLVYFASWMHIPLTYVHLQSDLIDNVIYMYNTLYCTRTATLYMYMYMHVNASIHCVTVLRTV